MKIKNISGKILGVGLALTVLPGEIKELPAEYENNPVIRNYVRRGIVKLVKAQIPLKQEESKQEEKSEQEEESKWDEKSEQEEEQKTAVEVNPEEKELSDMTAEELTDYAQRHGIDIGRSTNAGSILNKILSASSVE